MANEKTTLEQASVSPPAVTIEPAEPVYILPPHPEAHVVTSEETVEVEAPTIAEETLEDLVQSAVAGLKSVLQAELQSQLQKGAIENVKD
jgi:hypothetical protein